MATDELQEVVMSRRPERIVHQLQLRLLGNRSEVDMEASLASQISMLKDRVARLRRLGSRYARIDVSAHVRNLRKAAAAKGYGGNRVTTEV